MKKTNSNDGQINERKFLATEQHKAVTALLNKESIYSEFLSGLPESTDLTILETLLTRRRPVKSDELAKFAGVTTGAISQAIPRVNKYLLNICQQTESLIDIGIIFQIPKQGKTPQNRFGYYFACIDKNGNYLNAGQIKNCFEIFWENTLRKKLIEEATEHLKNKLGSSDIKDYQPLDLEIGTIEHEQYDNDALPENAPDIQVKKHGRIWRPYNIENLRKIEGTFILSSDVGTGKTTFLRHLQLKLLEKHKSIPVYIHASEMEKWQSIDYVSLEKHLKENLVADILEGIPKKFWSEICKEKLFLLVDGLDQITGTDSAYRNFLDDLLKLAGFVHIDMMVASRPSAVISAEDNEKVSFLQLKPFTTNVQNVYFGKHYDRALEVCKRNSKMMGIPMLAFMIRFVIGKKQDKDIRNRKDLYKRFIDYVFIKYKHEKISISWHKRLEIRRALQNISYEALADKKINPQRIPLGFCAERVSKLGLRIEVDDLSKHGLTNFIVNDAKSSEEIVFFTHQSFQEYLAAEWASESEDRINYLIENYWNPNWKEVIRFLINGKHGKDIIKRIYSDKITDNKIHSRLLLAAQLVSDVENESAYKHELFESLKDIVNKPFRVEALAAMIDMQTKESQDYAWDFLKKLSSGTFFFEIEDILNNSKYANTLFKMKTD